MGILQKVKLGFTGLKPCFIFIYLVVMIFLVSLSWAFEGCTYTILACFKCYWLYSWSLVSIIIFLLELVSVMCFVSIADILATI